MTNATPSSPGGGNDGGKPVSFNKGDAMRIAAAVQKVERGDRSQGPSKLPRAAGGGGASGFFRVEITGDPLTCGGTTDGAVLTWNGSGYDLGEGITVHDPLFLISSEYGNGQRLWCALMEDSELYEVVMPGSSCSCTGVSRERLAGMVFDELEEADGSSVKVLVVEAGCLKLIPTDKCIS
jgi:hypothetical protein